MTKTSVFELFCDSFAPFFTKNICKRFSGKISFSENAKSSFEWFDQNFKFCTAFRVYIIFSWNKFFKRFSGKTSFSNNGKSSFKGDFEIWLKLKFLSCFATVLRLFSWKAFVSVLMVKWVFLITQNLFWRCFNYLTKISNFALFWYFSHFIQETNF